MRKILVLLLLTFSAYAALANSVVVNCDEGQSLNAAISKLNKEGPNTVLVRGTCTEYVNIVGFENLTVKSVTRATLVQPSAIPTPLFLTLLRIDSSRSVTIDGLNFSSTASSPPAIGIGAGSKDVRLRNLNIVGGSVGIFAFETSQVSIARVTVKNAGWAYVFAVDESQLHVEDCLLEESSGTGWHEGIGSEASHVQVRRTTIRNMQVGLYANVGGEIGLVDFSAYYPAGGVTDVVIDNPAGTNSNGAVADLSANLYISSAKLRILNAGQPWGGSSGGILVSGGSSLTASSNLIIEGSHGQGIYATGNSHVTLDGSTITGSQHGGLVAVNLSTISTTTWDQPVTVSGNATDVFCDSQSVITGGVKIVGATTVQCPNLLPWDAVPIP
jgi:hypothetical protein